MANSAMKATDCCHVHRRPPSRWTHGVRGLLFAAFALLMPKCPLCIAAYLGALGLSGLAARVDPRVLWLVGSAAVALVAATVARWAVVWAPRLARRWGGAERALPTSQRAGVEDRMGRQKEEGDRT
jgi:hypothetical protein